MYSVHQSGEQDRLDDMPSSNTVRLTGSTFPGESYPHLYIEIPSFSPEILPKLP